LSPQRKIRIYEPYMVHMLSVNERAYRLRPVT